ncbi:hypothetical protein DXG01_004340 [Tephrocybe rancida]|nr:hypothetical protein DXG01_004340 [Tephrocybe rancida]
MDSIIRVVGAISLWSIEIIMMLRVYALYGCSKRVSSMAALSLGCTVGAHMISKVAFFNGVLFLGSVAAFLWVLIHNAQRRRAVIADAIHLPLPGCPSIHSGVEWLQWVPATVFEGILFGFALFKTLKTTTTRIMKKTKISLYSVLLRDNLFYFFAPFHAAMGILTTRMLINLRKTMTMNQIVSNGSSLAGASAKRIAKNRKNHLSARDIGSWHVATAATTTIGAGSAV